MPAHVVESDSVAIFKRIGFPEWTRCVINFRFLGHCISVVSQPLCPVCFIFVFIQANKWLIGWSIDWCWCNDGQPRRRWRAHLDRRLPRQRRPASDRSCWTRPTTSSAATMIPRSIPSNPQVARLREVWQSVNIWPSYCHGSFKYAFLPRTILHVDCNVLPCEVVEANSLSQFKRLLSRSHQFWLYHSTCRCVLSFASSTSWRLPLLISDRYNCANRAVSFRGHWYLSIQIQTQIQFGVFLFKTTYLYGAAKNLQQLSANDAHCAVGHIDILLFLFRRHKQLVVWYFRNPVGLTLVNLSVQTNVLRVYGL